ncbi:hypothetical protein L345_10325, partial [Ophiophagus hannah]
MPKNFCSPRPVIGLLRVNKVGPSSGAVLSWLLWAAGHSDIRDIQIEAHPWPWKPPGRSEGKGRTRVVVSSQESQGAVGSKAQIYQFLLGLDALTPQWCVQTLLPTYSVKPGMDVIGGLHWNGRNIRIHLLLALNSSLGHLQTGSAEESGAIKKSNSFQNTDIILEAEKTSRELLVWAEKIKELQTEIADLHYKLNHDWMAHKGFLYLLSYEIHNYYNTIEMCKKHKGYIVDILDDHEEEYLEEMTKEKHGSYWIGLIYKGGTWRWEVSQAKSLK